MQRPTPRDPVTIHFDGKPLVAERGEPVAAALLAAGNMVLARSSKFHRPRGPSCFRGACDGCLARVNETPNTMTCLVRAEEGLTVHSQNTLGSREVDLLRVTDWFFPEGMNHHELFAGVPGVQQVMQAFARRVAGLGRLPKENAPPRQAARRELDALVVGGGPAGVAAAVALSKRGREVEVIDDALEVGGGMRALGADEALTRAWAPTRDALLAAIETGAIRLRCETTAAGMFGDDMLIAGPEGAEVLRARTIVLAPGAHDGVLAFEGNDLPGVMSARAAGWLLSYGVVVGERAAVVVSEGGGPFGEAFARGVKASGIACEVTVVHGTPVRIDGSAHVRSVLVRTERGDRELAVDTVILDAPRAPAYEICAQAGATLRHEARGYVVANEHGRIRDGVWAVGEVVGTPLDPARMAAEAEALAERASR
jgi:sarcosine oxidase subunit alpha